MSEAADDLRKLLLNAAEEFQPLYEFAEGQREELRRRGWREEAADVIALDILRGFVAIKIGAVTPK